MKRGMGWADKGNSLLEGKSWCTLEAHVSNTHLNASKRKSGKSNGESVEGQEVGKNMIELHNVKEISWKGKNLLLVVHPKDTK